jgi:hypothetical protein
VCVRVSMIGTRDIKTDDTEAKKRMTRNIERYILERKKEGE